MLKYNFAYNVIFLLYLSSNVHGGLFSLGGEAVSAVGGAFFHLVPGFLTPNKATRTIGGENSSTGSGAQHQHEDGVYDEEQLKRETKAIIAYALDEFINKRKTYLKLAKENQPNAQIKQEVWNFVNEELDKAEKELARLRETLQRGNEKTNKDEKKQK